jgi:hypothetical protein
MNPRILLTLSVFLLTSFQTLAQRQVTGRLVDSSRSPLPRANVKLFVAGKDTLRTVTNNTGSFLFKNVPSARFIIRASNVGFNAGEKNFDLDPALEDVRLDDIVLTPAFETLKEVVVKTPPIQVKEDTIEYKIDSGLVKPNAMTEDLLKKLPGIEVDKNGDITAQGKKVTRVKVNGKDFFGGDAKAATRELPADMIDKVQIIDDYGDMANISGIKDGEPEKVLNLQLKKEKNRGVFGRATAGYGTNDRYQASGNANIFNDRKQLSVTGNSNNANMNVFNSGGAGGGMDLNSMGVGRASVATISQSGSGGEMGAVSIRPSGGGGGGGGGVGGGSDGITTVHSLGTNYREDFKEGKGSFYGSYSFTRRINDGFRDVSQQNFFGSGNFVNNTNTAFLNKGDNHRAFLNLEYNIDSFNYVKISPSFTYGDNDNRTVGDFEFLNDKGVRTSQGRNEDTTRGLTPNLSVNALFNHKFRKRGRNLAVNLNMGTSDNDSESEKLNLTRNLNLPVPVDVRLRQRIVQENASRNAGIRFNYSEPLRPDRFLDLIYSFNRSYSRTDRKTYTYLPVGEPELSPNLSNAFENVFVNQRFGANIRTVKKKYNHSIGINLQPVNLNGYSITKDSSYTPQRRVNVFPVARLAYNFSRTKTLNFNYQGNARQPSFSQLQPVLDISNPQYQTKGNPALKPERSHNLSLFYNNFNFTSGRVFFVGTNVNLVQDKIVNNTISLGRAGAQLRIPENVDGYYNLTAFANYSKPFQNRRYVLALNATVNYNHNINLIDSARNVGNNVIASPGFRFEFNPKDWFEWDFGARYTLNSARYSLPGQQDLDFSSWSLTSNSRIDVPGGWTLRYDFEYILNSGLAAGVNANVALLNASLEKTLFKKKNGFLRLSGFDIFNQNKNVSRTVNGNSITDTRVNRLTRYFMLTFTYRLNRFTGTQQQGGQRRMQGGEFRMQPF